MSTADKLNYLLETKQILKTSLINKGASVDDSTPFRDYASAIDNLSSGGYTIEGLLNGTEPKGKIVYDFSKVKSTAIANFFAYRTEITEVISENATTLPNFRECSKVTNLYFPLIKSSISQGLNSTGFSGAFRYDRCFPAVETLNQSTFNALRQITSITLPASVKTINGNAFNIPMPLLTTIYFLGTPTTIASNAIASGLTSITDIYVPWSEGEVANAPWGATNATIHYNTQFDENGNPITV